MTIKNFRVNNGITVGDIVIDAATNTIVGLSTAAPSADGDVSNKKYVDDSLLGLSQNSITQGNSNVTVTDAGTGTVTISADGSTRLTVAAAGVTVANGITFATNTADINGGTIDGTAIGALSASTAVFTDLTANGTINIDSTGNIDGITIGASSPAAGTFTTVTATNVQATNYKANDGTTAITISDSTGAITFADNVVITGNLNVQGTETIFNTQNLTVEDNIISTNSNISSSLNMPRFSGLHMHRGTGSTATELDLYAVWDDQYDVSGGSGLGGTFTFLGSAHSEGAESPTSDFTLADIRCNIIEATATTAQYSDIAERFEADALITPGAVVMLGGIAEITETAEDLSDKVFGVISTQPAYMMNNGAGNNDTHPFVAMTGRTPVRVTGEVRKGDRLVSSSVKGTARAASADETINPFHVIGRALKDKYDDGIGLVNCVVRTNN